jgi:hypothetical protein
MIVNHDISAFPFLMSLLEREAGENYLDVASTLQYFTLLAEEGSSLFSEWKLYHS